MPPHQHGCQNVQCICCGELILVCLDKHGENKFRYVECCGGIACDNGLSTHFCHFCKKHTNVSTKRKTSLPCFFPNSSVFRLTWVEYYRCLVQYRILSERPGFREFVLSSQFQLQWDNHLRWNELFNQYIFLHPILQLASMFRIRMYMRLGRSNASVFGLMCHRFTKMLPLCRANGVRVIHSINKIHVHFGIAFLCVTRISTELGRRKSDDGSVVVCSNTYWHTMIPWIIRWITRLPKRFPK